MSDIPSGINILKMNFLALFAYASALVAFRLIDLPSANRLVRILMLSSSPLNTLEFTFSMWFFQVSRTSVKSKSILSENDVSFFAASPLFKSFPLVKPAFIDMLE